MKNPAMMVFTLVGLVCLSVVVPFDVSGRETSPVEVPPSRLFERGYRAFQRGEYGTARSLFRRIVHDYPDSRRGRDSRYFLRRSRLYVGGWSSLPMIRIRLAGGDTLSGTTLKPVHVRGPGGRPGQRLPAKTPWTASTGPDSTIALRTSDTSIKAHSPLRLQPTGPGQDLRFADRSYRGIFELRPWQGGLVLVNVLPMRQYLYGVIRKEIAPDWPLEAIKAQSVAARSFALYRVLHAGDRPFDLKANRLSQVYGGRDAETERVVHAVDATRGEVLTYDGRVVPGYFHANSGGHIETASTVWSGSQTPYIVAKRDTWSFHAKYARWTKVLARRTINRGLIQADHPGLAEHPSFAVVREFASGRAQTLVYRTHNGRFHTLDAGEFRLAVGSNRLRSAWFEAIQDRRDGLWFRGRGWGHGVGMSQWGAYRMAKAGRNYRRILSFYYEKALVRPGYTRSRKDASRRE